VACTVVCISHATGAGGDDVGRRVAEQLGYLYVDEEIVARAAAQGGIEPEDVADEERRKSSAMRLLETVLVGTTGGSAWVLAGAEPVATEVPRSPEIRALIRETVVQTAARGEVVIVAHAASYAVERGAGALRVLVTASPTTRAQRVAALEGLEQAQAERVIKDSDAGRRDYLKRFYAVDREAPTDYDLVINTDVLSSGEAAEMIELAAKRISVT
jgi:cytidylate kinase